MSTKLNLPVLNTDAIRSEVIEDFGTLDSNELIKRSKTRAEEVLKSGIAFIYDASVDRNWEECKDLLIKYNYQWYIISLDLSKGLLVSLYEAKKYYESLERVDELIADHNKFLDKNKKDVGLHILDSDFKNRCQISFEKVVKLLNKKNISD